MEKERDNYQPNMERGIKNEAFEADTRSLQFNSVSYTPHAKKI